MGKKVYVVISVDPEHNRFEGIEGVFDSESEAEKLVKELGWKGCYWIEADYKEEKHEQSE